jgi:sialate O-acetylesterase
MKITDGLLPGQVLQRNDSNVGYAVVQGTSKGSGAVQIRVLKSGAQSIVSHWQHMGEAKGKTFRATLDGLRCGGPYIVELQILRANRVIDCCSVPDVYVGDVWFLAGQSNMEGVGNLDQALKPYPKVRAFYMRDEWGIAEEKIHFLSEAVDAVHNGYGAGAGRPRKSMLKTQKESCFKGVSPAMAFGLQMYKQARVPQGLVSNAHGGTSMEQWSPALRAEGGRSLYGAMMRRFQKLGQPIKGIIWYQGESDANAAAAPHYTRKMVDFVAHVRKDMGMPQLPWVIVQIGRHASSEPCKYWNRIQEQQRCLPSQIDHLDVVPAVDLGLDDGIHISGSGQNILGARLARAMISLTCRAKDAKPGIRLKNIEIMPTPGYRNGLGGSSLRVQYRHVAGSLLSAGLPTGFSLHDKRGKDVSSIFKTTLNGKSVTLHTNMARYQLEQLRLSYGHGRLPYCNIVDRENMSLPVMQYIPICTDAPETWSHDCWQTSYLHADGRLSALTYKQVEAQGGWQKACERTPFGVLPQPKTSKKTGLFGLRTCVVTKEDVEALLCFGANVPFRVWLNGEEVLQDLACTMPLTPDAYQHTIQLRSGENHIHVGISICQAAPHFGVSLRIGNLSYQKEARVSPKK